MTETTDATVLDDTRGFTITLSEPKKNPWLIYLIFAAIAATLLG